MYECLTISQIELSQVKSIYEKQKKNHKFKIYLKFVESLTCVLRC